MNKYPELNKLKGRMREKHETYRSMSKKVGIPLNTLNNKLNGYSIFDVNEAISICSVLDINLDEMNSFFSPDVT